MTVTFAGVLALSAFLVFWIQPLVARTLLPLLGGTPAVWNTCVLFFQGMLLAGYLYSHYLTRLSFRQQVGTHIAFFAIVATVLPSSAGQWIPPTDASNTLWLLGVLATFVGLPFVFLSSSAPLLQHWFGLSNRTSARDPYFLYAASNAGSFLSLLFFPTLLEQSLSISNQFGLWHKSYLALGLGLLVCVALVWNDGCRRSTLPNRTPIVSGRWPIANWLVLAFVPSSLMLGVTTHITTDIASVSFLWVLPLALYLATFIIAFSSIGERCARIAGGVLPVAVAAALIQLFRDGAASLLLIPIELTIVASVGLILHSRLYRRRPQTSQLTKFYLWVAFGGFLGGLLNGIVAPLIFPGVIEYPIVLAMGILIIEWRLVAQAAAIFRRQQWHGIRLAEVVVAGTFSVVISALMVGISDLTRTALVAVLLLMSFSAVMFAIGANKGARIWLNLCFIIYLGMSIAIEFDRGVHSGRTFFGAFRIDDTVANGVEYRRFQHGTTLHGLQAKDPELALTVQSYYAALVNYVWPEFGTRGPQSIAVTGLGTGTLACLAREEDHVTFFEIDPVVEEVAREYFTYLDDCPATTDVILGDARLSLADIADDTYDLLILDAFSSDSVPIHLLTNEAAMTYDRVLRDDGLLVFHISNRYIDLRPVLAQLALQHGWTSWEVTTEQRADRPLERDAVFVVVSRHNLADRLLESADDAKPLRPTDGFKLWTDDFSSLFAVVRYQRKRRTDVAD